MDYLIEKNIDRYTLVELFYVIEYSTDMATKRKAKNELVKRNLSEKELKDAKNDYIKYLTYKEKRKKESLSLEEWFSFFFMPFNMSSRLFTSKDFNDTEIDRYNQHGFKKKIKESKQARIFGLIFYFVLIPLVYLFVNWLKYRIEK